MELMHRRRGIMGLNGGAGIPVIAATATGNPLTFETDMVKPLKSLVIPFAPIQSDGTPSLDNPLPISGWTGATVQHKNRNLVDGTAIKDIIFTQITASSRGENPSGWVWFVPQSNVYPTILGPYSTDKRNQYTFKPNTQYTIIFTSTCQYTGNLNIGYTYTDGTSVVITQSTKSQVTHRIVTEANKSLRSIWVGRNTSGWTSIYYPTFCVCEGVVAKGDVPVQNGESLSIDWQSSAGTIYGGTLTLNEDGSADLVKKWGIANLGSLDWTFMSGQNCFESDYVYGILNTYNVVTIMCDCYQAISNRTTSAIDKAIWLNSSSGDVRSYFRVNDTDYGTDAAAFKLAMSGHYAVYRLPSSRYTTYHFDNIGQLIAFLGTNTIWTDTNDINTATYLKHQS